MSLGAGERVSHAVVEAPSTLASILPYSEAIFDVAYENPMPTPPPNADPRLESTLNTS